MNGRRGAILLEVIVSVAIFIAAAMTLIGVLTQSDAIAARAREQQIGDDLCRSAMAQIALGLSSPETMQGPVHVPEASGQGFADAPPPDSGWELQVNTEPSQFYGLLKVTIEATRPAGNGSRRVVSTLHQLLPSEPRMGGAR